MIQYSSIHTLQRSLIDTLENGGNPEEGEGKVEVPVCDLRCASELTVLRDKFLLCRYAQRVEV